MIFFSGSFNLEAYHELVSDIYMFTIDILYSNMCQFCQNYRQDRKVTLIFIQLKLKFQCAGAARNENENELLEVIQRVICSHAV